MKFAGDRRITDDDETDIDDNESLMRSLINPNRNKFMPQLTVANHDDDRQQISLCNHYKQQQSIDQQININVKSRQEHEKTKAKSVNDNRLSLFRRILGTNRLSLISSTQINQQESVDNDGNFDGYQSNADDVKCPDENAPIPQQVQHERPSCTFLARQSSNLGKNPPASTTPARHQQEVVVEEGEEEGDKMMHKFERGTRTKNHDGHDWATPTNKWKSNKDKDKDNSCWDVKMLNKDDNDHYHHDHQIDNRSSTTTKSTTNKRTTTATKPIKSSSGKSYRHHVSLANGLDQLMTRLASIDELAHRKRSNMIVCPLPDGGGRSNVDEAAANKIGGDRKQQFLRSSAHSAQSLAAAGAAASELHQLTPAANGLCEINQHKSMLWCCHDDNNSSHNHKTRNNIIDKSHRTSRRHYSQLSLGRHNSSTQQTQCDKCVNRQRQDSTGAKSEVTLCSGAPVCSGTDSSDMAVAASCASLANVNHGTNASPMDINDRQQRLTTLGKSWHHLDNENNDYQVQPIVETARKVSVRSLQSKATAADHSMANVLSRGGQIANTTKVSLQEQQQQQLNAVGSSIITGKDEAKTNDRLTMGAAIGSSIDDNCTTAIVDNNYDEHIFAGNFTHDFNTADDADDDEQCTSRWHRNNSLMATDNSSLFVDVDIIDGTAHDDDDDDDEYDHDYDNFMISNNSRNSNNNDNYLGVLDRELDWRVDSTQAALSSSSSPSCRNNQNHHQHHRAQSQCVGAHNKCGHHHDKCCNPVNSEIGQQWTTKNRHWLDTTTTCSGGAKSMDNIDVVSSQQQQQQQQQQQLHQSQTTTNSVLSKQQQQSRHRDKEKGSKVENSDQCCCVYYQKQQQQLAGNCKLLAKNDSDYDLYRLYYSSASLVPANGTPMANNSTTKSTSGHVDVNIDVDAVDLRPLSESKLDTHISEAKVEKLLENHVHNRANVNSASINKQELDQQQNTTELEHQKSLCHISNDQIIKTCPGVTATLNAQCCKENLQITPESVIKSVSYNESDNCDNVEVVESNKATETTTPNMQSFRNNTNQCPPPSDMVIVEMDTRLNGERPEMFSASGHVNCNHTNRQTAANGTSKCNNSDNNHKPQTWSCQRQSFDNRPIFHRPHSDAQLVDVNRLISAHQSSNRSQSNSNSNSNSNTCRDVESQTASNERQDSNGHRSAFGRFVERLTEISNTLRSLNSGDTTSSSLASAGADVAGPSSISGRPDTPRFRRANRSRSSVTRSANSRAAPTTSSPNQMGITSSTTMSTTISPSSTCIMTAAQPGTSHKQVSLRVPLVCAPASLSDLHLDSVDSSSSSEDEDDDDDDNVNHGNNRLDINHDDTITIASTHSNASSSAPFCKICHLGHKDNDRLISPCKCSGTMQYIHCSCLLKWLEISNRDTRKPLSCELCHYEYLWHRKFDLRSCRWPKCHFKDKLLHLIFVLSVVVMFSCAVSLLFCFRHDRNTSVAVPASILSPTSMASMAHQSSSSSSIGNGAQMPLSRRANNARNRNHDPNITGYHHNQLSGEEKMTLLCGILFFSSFFIAMYVQIKARHTLYQLFSKFFRMNQRFYITEYDHESDIANHQSLCNDESSTDDTRALSRRSSTISNGLGTSNGSTHSHASAIHKSSGQSRANNWRSQQRRRQQQIRQQLNNSPAQPQANQSNQSMDLRR